jgi:hypothetical protein
MSFDCTPNSGLNYAQLLELAYPGDIIYSPSSKKLFKVTKVNPKNYKCIDETGQEWNVRITKNIKKMPADTPFNAPPPVVTSDLVLGSVVEFTGKGAQKFPGKYVLIKHTGDDRASFAKLGGDSDRYVRADKRGVKRVEL